MKKKKQKTNVINVFGLANIGCTIHNATYQTIGLGNAVQNYDDDDDFDDDYDDDYEEFEDEEEVETAPEEPAGVNLNYFAPQKNIAVFLCQDWFDEVSADKKKYTKVWRESLMEALMNSEFKDDIAEEWTDDGKRIQLKCEIVGVLKDAGVIKGSYRSVASCLDFGDVKPASLARYMSNAKKQPCYDWLLDFAKG